VWVAFRRRLAGRLLLPVRHKKAEYRFCGCRAVEVLCIRRDNCGVANFVPGGGCGRVCGLRARYFRRLGVAWAAFSVGGGGKASPALGLRG
jgi:hypothetical protein